ncbi:MAG: dipeptide/oligopeptide/nickel ABC transporter ATP-binding protein, partial [Anaerolineae bacterium]|nr:dipeptide/oligopeptide/nickel ABC transporter ATP-binding protein [Anaerolineae bacterium]
MVNAPANAVNVMTSPHLENDENLLEVRDLQMFFPIRQGFFSQLKGYVKAVDGVSFDVRR